MSTTEEVATRTLAIHQVVSDWCTTPPTVKEPSITAWGSTSRKATASAIKQNLTQLPWRKTVIASPRVKTISTLSSREKWVSLRTTSTWWTRGYPRPRRPSKWAKRSTKIHLPKCNYSTKSLCTAVKRSLKLPKMTSTLTLRWECPQDSTPSPKNKCPAHSPWTTPNTPSTDSKSG